MAVVDQIIGSLGDLASMEGMPSEPTLKKLIDGDPDFPVIVRGKQGAAWEIDLGVAWTYVRDTQKREEDKARAHREKVAQLGLNLLGEGALIDDLNVLSLSPAEQNAAMNAEYLRIKLAEKRGELVLARDVQSGLAEDIVWMSDGSRSVSGKCAKRGKFSRDQLDIIDRVLEELMKQYADRLEGQIESVEPSGESETATAVSLVP